MARQFKTWKKPEELSCFAVNFKFSLHFKKRKIELVDSILGIVYIRKICGPLISGMALAFHQKFDR